jgi:hypothetical protein
MLQEIIRGGITTENVAAVEKMISLYERMQDRKAEQDFAVAFNSLMAEIPSIRATKPVPNNDGTVRYRYAPLEEIDAQLRPLALKHGFTYSFREGESDAGRITKICEVQHVNGHKRSNPFTVRVSAPPKSSESQADGSTHSYAKRGALCDAFGIIIEHLDDDAREIGRPIGRAMAEDLMARVLSCSADEVAFLRFAGVTVEHGLLPTLADYEKIGLNRFDALDEILTKKERRR